MERFNTEKIKKTNHNPEKTGSIQNLLHPHPRISGHRRVASVRKMVETDKDLRKNELTYKIKKDIITLEKKRSRRSPGYKSKMEGLQYGTTIIGKHISFRI